MWLHLNFNFGSSFFSMKKSLQKLILIVSGLVLITGITTVNANESEHNELGPEITIPESSGEKCILPEAEMRRRHPDLLKHDRIQTLREGVRAKADGKTLDGSLKQCVNCHAVKDESNKYVRIDNDQHFCASCHKYAAVSIDCFQCHRDIPEGSGEFHALTDRKGVNYSNVVPGSYSLTTEDMANIAPEVNSDDN